MQSPLAFSKLFLKKKVGRKSLNFKLKQIDPSTVQERFSLMSIYLSQNQSKKAEILFNRTWKTNPLDIKSQDNIELVNAFIKCNLNTSSIHASNACHNIADGNIQRAWDWFKRIKEIGSKANVETFGIMIYALMRKREFGKIKELLDEFQDSQLELEKLLKFDGIQENLSELKALISDYPKLELDIGYKNDLLKSVLKDEYSDKISIEEEAEEYLQELKGRKKDVVQSGAIGVKILKKTLGELKSSSHVSDYEKQLWLEERAHAAALEEVEEFMKKLPDSIRKITHLPSDLVWEWNQKLVPAIEARIKALEDGIDEKSSTKTTFLKLLPISTLSRITIAEFLKLQAKREDEGDGSIKEKAGLRKALSVVLGIGKSIEREYNLRQLKKNKNLIKTNFKLHKLHSNGKLFNISIRNIAKELQESHSVDWTPFWPNKTLVEIGTELANEMINVAVVSVKFDDPEDPKEKIVKDEAAFTHRIIPTTNGKQVGYIEYHPALYDLILQQPLQTQPWFLPMITHPAPWVKWNSGGYLSQRDEVIRVDFNPEHRRLIMAADKKHHLDTILKALDVLGSTPWKINTNVLEIMLQFWERGIDAPHLPAKYNIPPPIKPSTTVKDAALIRKYNSELKKHQQSIQNNFSQRCDVHYKIEVAKAFQNEVIYFPHNMDFRGRAYPMPPHLNHLGSDLCRGLLIFAKGKPLGPNGLNWLKIQIASLMGHDKKPFEGRIKFVEMHLDEVFDSAAHPFDGRRWWLTAEDPWQCLAACFELAAALKSPNPDDFISHIPIHQDGTCNGLQHYAALGGDQLGAKQVNMVPAEGPQDLYTAVSSAVQNQVDVDASNNVHEAILMKHRVNRKLVKQTVMTNTYGVTFIGARRQVSNRLKEARVHEPTPLSDDELQKCSFYITKLIFQCMGEMFSGAKETQLWLNKAARMISMSVNSEQLSEKELTITEELMRRGIIKSAEEQNKESSLNSETLLDSAMLDKEEDDFEVVEDDDYPLPVVPASLEKKKISRMQSVSWTTPIGLPIVQPYRFFKTQDVDTALQSFRVTDPTVPEPVNSQKQSSAFPPNFIHSLDACHMMLSALECQRAGLTYASVHDSYWTHACDVEKMSSILREEFIRLHDQPLLKHLKTEFESRYSTHYIPAVIPIPPEISVDLAKSLKALGARKNAAKISKVKAWIPLVFDDPPEKGEFDISLIRKSKYFFH